MYSEAFVWKNMKRGTPEPRTTFTVRLNTCTFYAVFRLFTFEKKVNVQISSKWCNFFHFTNHLTFRISKSTAAITTTTAPDGIMLKKHKEHNIKMDIPNGQRYCCSLAQNCEIQNHGNHFLEPIYQDIPELLDSMYSI